MEKDKAVSLTRRFGVPHPLLSLRCPRERRARRLSALLVAMCSIHGLGLPNALAQTAASPGPDLSPPEGTPGTTEALAPALSSSLAGCLADFRPQARAKDVSQGTLDAAFSDVSPDPDVLAAARRQPEFVKPIWDYLDAAVSDSRIATGQTKLAEWTQVLEAVEKTYGVDRHIVLAIWGIESSYGAVLDDPKVVKPVIRSLATLACGDPDRAGFWREQLLAALQLLERGEIAPNRLTGSWAGAVGHTQFIPTTYQAHAVDFDQDGRRDLWSSVPDALASTANYLRVSGWRAGETWGHEVELPQGFDYALADGTTRRPISEWMQLGVRPAQEPAFPSTDANAALMLPAGARGPAFLILPNFGAILRYNNAAAYALAVGHLADRIRGGNAFVRAWPRDDRPLAISERRELQMLLARRGFDAGPHDGRLGPKTRAAVRDYQRAAGLPADGYPNAVLLERLRAEP